MFLAFLLAELGILLIYAGVTGKPVTSLLVGNAADASSTTARDTPSFARDSRPPNR